MTRATILGRLTAAEDRRLKGWLLPFGTPGQTNLGRVVVNPGDVDVPAPSSLFANLDHLDGRDPVATFAIVEERPEGLWAEWDVPVTHGGDRLLAEFRSGVRTGISVELEPVTIRDGRATGTLIGCAFPVAPAFPTARLVAEQAPDTDPETPEDVARRIAAVLGLDWSDLDDTDRARYVEAAQTLAAAPSTTTDLPHTPDAPAGAEDNPAPTAEQDDDMTNPPALNASAPAALLAGLPTQPATPAAPGHGLEDVMRLLAEAHSVPAGQQRARLLAALEDVVAADVADMSVPQWVGELWSGVAYQRRYVPLINNAPLTGMNMQGWRWVTKPEVDVYSGNKAAVPSNAVDTEPVTKAATRWAGAHDIDRKFRDFGDSGFFAAYYAAMTESYARKSDLHIPGQLKAGATVVTAGAVPSGVSAAMAAIVDGALAVIDKGVPTFAIVEKSLYRGLLLTPKDQVLEYLSASLGLEDGTIDSFRIVPAASTAVGDASSTTGLDVGEVLVGIRSAATFYELGGGTPIRAEAVDMVNGGIDAGVFGYGGVIVHDSDGLALVDTDADS